MTDRDFTYSMLWWLNILYIHSTFVISRPHCKGQIYLLEDRLNNTEIEISYAQKHGTLYRYEIIYCLNRRFDLCSRFCWLFYLEGQNKVRQVLFIVSVPFKSKNLRLLTFNFLAMSLIDLSNFLKIKEKNILYIGWISLHLYQNDK